MISTGTNWLRFIVLIVPFVCTQNVHGSHFCQSSGVFEPSRHCSDDEYCCGMYNNACCTRSDNMSSDSGAVVGLLIVLIVLFCCPYMCYRCCCRRTTSRGIIYSQAGPSSTTAVSVTLPPQYNQPVPYPTVVPYPQQTPYPPQPSTNPYYGMPPPPYGYPTQADVQQASAPTAAQNTSAPYLNS